MGRVAKKEGGRTNDTIKRLKMYQNGKAVRNKEGKIVGGQVRKYEKEWKERRGQFDRI